MKLSANFSLQELTFSSTAERQGIDNSAPDDVVKNLRNLAVHILQPVRSFYNSPVMINSGYRGPELNAAIGGSTRSQHMKGQAADFEVAGYSNYEVAEWVMENLDFDQLILEFWYPNQGPRSGWVHCSYKNPDDNRNQVLTINKHGTFNGLYTG